MSMNVKRIQYEYLVGAYNLSGVMGRVHALNHVGSDQAAP